MEKIAVIGLSTLFPGSHTPRQYWQNLLDGADLRSTAGQAQMGVAPEAYHHPEKGRTDRYYCLRGGFITDFDLTPTGFDLAPGFVEQLDDLHQWSLHVAREALRDSGYLGNEAALARAGVVLGNLSFPTRLSNHLALPLYHGAVEANLRTLLGDETFHLAPFAPPQAVPFENALISGYPSALIAKGLSLSGPSLSMDAACASSIYSVKLAIDYLLSGRADMMLAGAVSAGDPFFIHMGFSIFQAYPEAGISAPLDKNSGGLFSGEGAGMFVLKRYSDALREGDRIHAVISGVGLSNDGRGQSVLSPGISGQIKAFERAYDNAGVDPSKVAYVECHATGTPLGDKVELDSMDAFFGRRGNAPQVGSAKSNLGHLLTAAGMAGMVKVMFSLKEGKIPPTINLEAPASSKGAAMGGAGIPTRTVPWPGEGNTRDGAISGFGFGGTNGHLILEHRDSPAAPPPPSEGGPREKAPTPMAIVGMDCVFGPCEGLLAFSPAARGKIQPFGDLPDGRWKGMERYSEQLAACGFPSGSAPAGAYVDRFSRSLST